MNRLEIQIIIDLQRKVRRMFIAAALSSIVLAGCEPREEKMNVTELTEFATRYAAAWSSQDPVSFASFYAENGSLTVNTGVPSIGRQAIESTARDFMTAFPDMVVMLIEVKQDGRNVVFRWHWIGTNTGPGGTGNAVDIYGYEEWTIDSDGLIAESLGHYDEAEYERQVNAARPGM